MTTKKVIREVTYTDTSVDVKDYEKYPTLTSVTERKFVYSQVEHESVEKFSEACEAMAVQAISDIFDRKTVVLEDSNGKYFAVAGYNIVSATAYVIDSLDV